MSRQFANRSLLSTRRLFSSKKCETPELKHDGVAKQFYMQFPECRAFVSYRLAPHNPKHITLEHTEVPSRLAGKGIGKQLAQSVLKKLCDEQYQVEIECSFLQKFKDK